MCQTHRMDPFNHLRRRKLSLSLYYWQKPAAYIASYWALKNFHFLQIRICEVAVSALLISCLLPVRTHVHDIANTYSTRVHTNMFCKSSFVISLCGRVGSSLGVPYRRLLIAYRAGLSSHLTLNHQSQTNTACENWVPLGHRKVAWRPSMSQ